jgi:dTDP-4-dehydrorhamnose 3,5-epimerase
VFKKEILILFNVSQDEIYRNQTSRLFCIEPNVIRDERGYFMESFNEKLFKTLEQAVHFVQDNQSFSSKGVLRGLHYQTGEHAQAKLVRVIKEKF